MDQNSRAQIRLILDDANIRAKKAVDDGLNAIYADHAAKGLLQSGATIRVAMAAMKEIGSKFITTCVDQVATVAKDVEAFSMIDEAVTILLWFLDGQIAGIVAKAAGGGGQMGGFERISQAAEAQFSDRRRDLQRQLEIQRFTFTVPQQPLAATPSPPPPAVSKGRGGKPLAAHWDEMWAAIAVMLYTGDLQPKTQADIERSMKDWLAGHDLDVGDTAIRDRARRLSVRFQEAE